MKDVDLLRARDKAQEIMIMLEETTGQKINRCYQCMKCTGSCPFEFAMDYPPNVIIRMVQNGLIDEVLRSYTIHTCAECGTCSSRCPRDIDIVKVMDSLRIMSERYGIKGKSRKTDIYHSVFLNSIKHHGRLYELGVALNFNLQTGRIFQNIKLNSSMLVKGKLPLWPQNLKDQNEVERLFQYAEENGE